jgi:hypothetical protein
MAGRNPRNNAHLEISLMTAVATLIQVSFLGLWNCFLLDSVMGKRKSNINVGTNSSGRWRVHIFSQVLLSKLLQGLLSCF